ncbi:hypothetical protein [Dyadobacter alkalitolerans]|uniref:hypothetical protein n=1 Tax=Dyadobacter alkalitolerans TaxID=492736 RepID=UPI000417225D|nr:hypothetical protein [Dyadobacter alkalitolerans]
MAVFIELLNTNDPMPRLQFFKFFGPFLNGDHGMNEGRVFVHIIIVILQIKGFVEYFPESFSAVLA